MNVIEAKGLTIRFGKQTLIHDLSFSIRAGEFVGLLGPNGAGKSTLLKAILGLVPLSAGELKVLGGKTRLNNANIAYFPQSRQTVFHSPLTVFELLAITLRAEKWGLPLLNGEDKKTIDRVLLALGAENLSARSLQTLSGGERQRVWLAQALVRNPKILLLDEPLNNLDPRYQEQLIELIAKVAKENQIAVLFTAHDVNALLPVMDRVMYIVRGEAAIGSVDEVITTSRLSALYGTAIEVLEYKNRFFVIGRERAVSDTHHHHCGEH